MPAASQTKSLRKTKTGKSVETQTLDLVILKDDPNNEIHRAVTLSNDNWLVLSQCVEAFADTYRTRHSQTIATFVTRGQLDQAQSEAVKMNALLQTLDKLQAKLL